MRDAPAASALPVPAESGEGVEPAGHRVRVPEKSRRLELALAHERLRVDHQPLLARRSEDVPAVEVLVHEVDRRPVHRAVDVECGVEKSPFERLACADISLWNDLGPAIRRVGGEHEGVGLADGKLEAREQLGDDGEVVDSGMPQLRSRNAALDEESTALAIAGVQQHRSPSAPVLEGVGLGVGFGVRRRVQLENELARRNDERVWRVDRLLELERPLLRAFGYEPGQRVEPRGLVAPGAEEGGRKGHRGSVGRTRRIRAVDAGFLERALELAENGRGTTHPNPVVGAVVVAGGEIVGEGWHERRGGPHAEVVALDAAGAHVRGATVYVTLEPCAHHGTTPPCVDALLAAGVSRVVAGQLDPHPDHGGGLERLRESGVDVELADGELGFRCRQQIEEWRTWVTTGRPFVTYKVAVALDGRVRVPGARWVTGEDSRRLVHVLRAQADVVAVGMGTVRWDNPRLDARDVPVVRQPRRIAFGKGPLPDDSELELRSGPLGAELEQLASEGAQSVLLEGGPTLAAAFLERGLVDKLLVFVAPRISGEGPGMLEGLPRPLELRRMEARPIGDDVLIQAYLNEP